MHLAERVLHVPHARIPGAADGESDAARRLGRQVAGIEPQLGAQAHLAEGAGAVRQAVGDDPPGGLLGAVVKHGGADVDLGPTAGRHDQPGVQRVAVLRHAVVVGRLVARRLVAQAVPGHDLDAGHEPRKLAAQPRTRAMERRVGGKAAVPAWVAHPARQLQLQAYGCFRNP